MTFPLLIFKRGSEALHAADASRLQSGCAAEKPMRRKRPLGPTSEHGEVRARSQKGSGTEQNRQKSEFLFDFVRTGLSLLPQLPIFLGCASTQCLRWEFNHQRCLFRMAERHSHRQRGVWIKPCSLSPAVGSPGET